MDLTATAWRVFPTDRFNGRVCLYCSPVRIFGVILDSGESNFEIKPDIHRDLPILDHLQHYSAD
jgi:hypothetical protein